jgi:hypothetical protein
MKIQTTSILDLTTLLEKALTENFSFKKKPLLTTFLQAKTLTKNISISFLLQRNIY